MDKELQLFLSMTSNQHSYSKGKRENSFFFLLFSSGYLKAKQYMEEENYDKIISECTKEIDSGGRYTAEALLLRATFYLLIGNATAAQPDLDRVINMQDANVKVRTRLGSKWQRQKKTARHKPVSFLVHS